MRLAKYICHRKPERSFFYKNHQFPVCARCTGFYSGLVFYLILNYFTALNVSLELFVISLMLMIPAGVDGITQYFGPRESTNNLRFVTGFLGGIGLIIFLEIVFGVLKSMVMI